jgi:PST family polysaccharide transporter
MDTEQQVKHPFNKAIKWSFLLSWGRSAISTPATFLLAALLGPKQFGIVAIAAIYVSFLELFLNQGLESALVQRKELSNAHINSAFWLITFFGVILTSVSVLLGHFWAKINGEPLIAPIIAALSSTLLMSGLSIVPQALLKRNLRFRELAIRSTGAELGAGVAAIVSALSGLGVWALVIQQVTRSVLSAVVLWGMSGWKPKPFFSYTHLREILSFSSAAFLGTIGNFVQRQADLLLLGLFFGPALVGLLRFADRLKETALSLVTRPVSGVSLANLARLQSDPEALKQHYLELLKLSFTLALPLLGWLSICSYAIVDAVGAQWRDSAVALSLLGVVGVFQSFTLLTGPVLQAKGRPLLMSVLVWTLGLSNLSLFALLAPLLSRLEIDHQTSAVAALRLILFSIVYIPVNVYVSRRILNTSFKDILNSARHGILITISLSPAIVIIQLVFAATHPVLKLFALAISGALFGLITFFQLNPGSISLVRLNRKGIFRILGSS